VACWLWRHIDLYDPRADQKVRDAKRLRGMAEVDAMGGHLYYVVGQRALRAFNPDMQALLDDPALFEKIAVLWAARHPYQRNLPLSGQGGLSALTSGFFVTRPEEIPRSAPNCRLPFGPACP